jgi:hypothetical protein
MLKDWCIHKQVCLQTRFVDIYLPKFLRIFGDLIGWASIRVNLRTQIADYQ